ncbi:FixH family protein [Rhizobium sophoriradicis]|uniref:Cation transporter n=1 Tax=Rhizobium sophoriradicis TaxID=1535245 RepID=A0A2A5KMA7_9HYPH|nr:FixH family protein [Rhizobium sophoriradicis]PCK78143.1 cation transporter [Rhizobium sophoriradicis]
MNQGVAQRTFTGHHMLFAMASFFAVVIAVNAVMATLASSRWSGLVVEDSYVASQEFNSKVSAIRAMAASGLSGNLSVSHEVVHYDIENRGGAPAMVQDVTLTFRRPVGDREDFQLVLTRKAEGRFEVEHHVPPGDWIVEILSRNRNETVMHEAIRVNIAEFGR